MARYEVLQAGYVPVGPGFKYKFPGQIVTLKAADARKLGDAVRKLDKDEERDGSVAKRNTPQPQSQDHVSDSEAADAKAADSKADSEAGADPETSAVVETETVREVRADAGESTPAHERAGDETGQRP